MSTHQANKNLSTQIKTYTQSLATVTDKRALLAILDELATLPQPIRYHYRQRWIACTAGLVFSGLLALLCYHYGLPAAWFGLPAGLGLMSVIPLLLAWLNVHRLQAFTQALYWHNALLDNALQIVPHNDGAITKGWQQHFAELQRGNHQREFRQLIRGHYTGAEHQFYYHYFHFHYVNKRTQVTTNGKGQVQTRTVYDHFDRYGLIIPFPYCRHLFITAFAADGIKGERYTSDSGRFNKLFQVRAADTMQAARFLKPAVIIALEEQATALKQLNLAFSEQGELCISFADKDVLDSKPAYGLDQLTLFRQSIEQPTALPKLSQLLATVHQLLRHSDSNF